MAKTGVTVERLAEDYRFLVGEAEALVYHAGAPLPAGVDEKFRRSGYIHPVRTPHGVAVTDDFPPDHLHHKGVWLAWTKTAFDGRRPDFWNIGEQTGTVRCAGVSRVAVENDFAELVAEHEYVDLSSPRGEQTVLVETWRVKVWDAGALRLWDLEVRQRCARPTPLLLPQYRYGGLGVRGLRTWDAAAGRLLTSDGKTRIDGNESRGRWCDISGPVADAAAGLTVFSHPENFRHPEPLRLHPAEPFLCFAPSQMGDWSIEPDRDYFWRYRFHAHDGWPNVSETEALWFEFAAARPPWAGPLQWE